MISNNCRRGSTINQLIIILQMVQRL